MYMQRLSDTFKNNLKGDRGGTDEPKVLWETGGLLHTPGEL